MMRSRTDRTAFAIGRRNLLRRSVAAVGAATLGGPLAFLRTKALARGDGRCGTRRESPYGPLVPTRDESSGLELIMLPKGFRYRTLSWQGDRMADGNFVPPGHDGMAVIAMSDSAASLTGNFRSYTLIRNHEVFFHGPTAPIAPDFNYDPTAGAGTTILQWRAGELIDHRVGLSGTIANCAGGPTPWGTWLTCEEQIADNGGIPHGYVFESTVGRVAKPAPLTAMGRFRHEAIAFDPDTGTVFLTEDSSKPIAGDWGGRSRGNSGFYMFTPNDPLEGAGSLEAGGRLFMLRAKNRDSGAVVDDLRDPQCGAKYRVEWVPIKTPDAGPVGKVSGPYAEGRGKGAARFQRCEGCWWDPVEKEVVFVDTEAGPIDAQPGSWKFWENDRGEGAVWAYNPATSMLRNLFVSQGAMVPEAYGADNPDNVTVSTNGGILLCENGERDDGDGVSLLGLLPSGQTFEFARNIINIGADNFGALRAAGHDPEAIGTGDFSEKEWTGATFSPDGKFLFVNIQVPGITFAITGPFSNGIF